MSETEFSVYILRCGDGSLYTGIASDVARRLGEHEAGPRGAKYLKGRRPLTLVYAETAGDRARASRIEHRVKKLGRTGKEALIEGRILLSDLLPD